MSKAKNGFEIIRLRREKAHQAALYSMATHISEDCDRCPLRETPRCAQLHLPPAFLDDKTACSDWIVLHYLGKADEVTGKEVPE